jgi:hypothetical protein
MPAAPSAAPPSPLTTTVDSIVRSLFPVHVLHSLMRGERVRPERKEEFRNHLSVIWKG